MPEHSPADQQMIAILEELRLAVGEGFEKFEPHEVARIRAILRHSETLVQLAAYEEARGLLWAHWRGVILGGAALVSAVLVLWGNAARVLGWLAKAAQ